MKRFLSLLSVCLCAVILSSCEEPNPTETPEDNATYYVKYEASSSHYLSSVTVNTDIGKQTFNARTSTTFSETFGPVNRGFDASIECAVSGLTYIYVSKENGPFALKASGGKSASYTIDF
ncbi:MAG: hypothetical protein IKC30_02285 [Rikenellaceae bacterium]|nr:hypothetical protein [Rikenellaceae bacterium]